MIDRLRGWMEAERVSAAYLTDPVSIAYLTGFHTDPHERLMALVVTHDRATLVVPGLEEQSALAAAAAGVAVRGWRDGQDPLEVVVEALGTPLSLAVEKDSIRLGAYERLCARVGERRLVDAGTQLRRMRALKSRGELEALEAAGAVTDQVAVAIVGELHPGVSETEVALRIGAMVAERGGTLSFPTIVQSGPNSAQPHLRPTGRRIEEGDLVLLDFGAACRGYRADITRTVVVGQADSRQQEVHRVVLAAHDAGLQAVRAGARAGEVDEAARAVIRAAGLGDFFIHRVGHGLGLEAHEDPSLDPGSAFELAAGMVVTVEPGVYIPGWGGVRIEDDVSVEPDGCRLLTHAPHSIDAR